ncbi:5'-3' exonuclease, N-terminal resolvase-like domain, putative [Plasmodium malariae]|uniref:5'-3' exonuclease, N-terminal resolvase-like domain, putative n=1 Tax=Plasmodium malariae TaxID=5858 RepID=A0A1C3KAT7_PLAMA|nr:5'-3' exonuclease, N-terminal resolvase-like domain, putative [Plasmodium malariae]
MFRTFYVLFLFCVKCFILCNSSKTNINMKKKSKSSLFFIPCNVKIKNSVLFINSSLRESYNMNKSLYNHKNESYYSKIGLRKKKDKESINGYLKRGYTKLFGRKKNKEGEELENENQENIYETFLIIDGSSILFKNFFGMPYLKNNNDVNLSTIYGFIQSLNKIYKLLFPTYVVIIFDSKTSNDDKKKIYSKYKIFRKKNPEELYEQLKIVSEFCNVIGIKTISSTDVESDNYIAQIVETISNTVKERDHLSCNNKEELKDVEEQISNIIAKKKRQFRVIIVSSDKDLLQLLEYNDDAHNNMNISVCQPNRKYRLVNADLFFEEHNILPCQYSDYLILAGDQTDGISGVPSIGDKTSKYLLKEFHSIDNILQNLHKIPSKLHPIFLNNIDNINIFRKIIKLKCETNDTLVFDEYRQGSIKDFEVFQNFVDKYSLHKLLRKSIIVNYVGGTSKTHHN